eukprot:TRINITY_DN2988_c0_g1_i1.p1 TRINITY_DN2988_c0_g1~~TRINITY_DN2988_c0_g1_i1.p1  ORF type:complete len:509 (-),score=23.01 TRINITY_DN2988_c0_g1_i1:162-1688(-)
MTFLKQFKLNLDNTQALFPLQRGLKRKICFPVNQNKSLDLRKNDKIIRNNSLVKLSRTLLESQLSPPQNSNSNAEDIIENAFKLSASILRENNSVKICGRSVVETTLTNVALLVQLCQNYLSLDAETIAAVLLKIPYQLNQINVVEIRSNLGLDVAGLVYDMMRIRELIDGAQLHIPDVSKIIKEACLNLYEVRAIIAEVVWQLDMLRNSEKLPQYKQNQIALETLQIYAPLGYAVGIEKVSTELEILALTVLFPRGCEQTRSRLQNNFFNFGETLDRVRKELQMITQNSTYLHTLCKGIQIQYRYKSLQSTMKKLVLIDRPNMGGRSWQDIFDILGIRIIIEPLDDSKRSEVFAEKACYEIFDIICHQWTILQSRTKDYILNPKSNGYRSLHTTIEIKNGGLIEIQIRTLSMHKHAEGGSSAHGAYKSGLTNPFQIQQKYLKPVPQQQRLLLQDGCNSPNYQIELPKLEEIEQLNLEVEILDTLSGQNKMDLDYFSNQQETSTSKMF